MRLHSCLCVTAGIMSAKFEFGEEKDEEFPITINLVAGSIDHNREMLVGDALRYIGAVKGELSMRVQSDKLSVWGIQDCWNILSGGVKTVEIGKRLFGDDLQKTYLDSACASPAPPTSAERVPSRSATSSSRSELRDKRESFAP